MMSWGMFCPDLAFADGLSKSMLSSSEEEEAVQRNKIREQRKMLVGEVDFCQ